MANYANDVYTPLAHDVSMISAWHTVSETLQFLRDAASAGVSDDERKAIVESVATNPGQGVEIRGSGGVRKFRAGRGVAREIAADIEWSWLTLAPTFPFTSSRSCPKATGTIFQIEKWRHLRL